MTRDEAIQKVKAALPASAPHIQEYRVPIGQRVTIEDPHAARQREAERAVDIAVALGLKLDEPKTIERAASDALIGSEFNAYRIAGLE